MRYLIRIPDPSMHDATTCPGGRECEAHKSMENWDRANPVWRTFTDQASCARMFRERFPDALGAPMIAEIGDDALHVIPFLANEEAVKRSQLKMRPGPVAIVEAVPEDRADRKALKKREVWMQHLWTTGFIKELHETLLERKIEMRSSLRVGPTTLPFHVGLNANGDFEMQVPGTLSFVMPAEFMEAIGNLPSSVKR